MYMKSKAWPFLQTLWYLCHVVSILLKQKEGSWLTAGRMGRHQATLLETRLKMQDRVYLKPCDPAPGPIVAMLSSWLDLSDQTILELIAAASWTPPVMGCYTIVAVQQIREARALQGLQPQRLTVHLSRDKKVNIHTEAGTLPREPFCQRQNMPLWWYMLMGLHVRKRVFVCLVGLGFELRASLLQS
jgi:hypothetical protein